MLVHPATRAPRAPCTPLARPAAVALLTPTTQQPVHPQAWFVCMVLCPQVHLHSDELVVIADGSARTGPLRPQSDIQDDVLQICSMFSDVATVTHFAMHYTDTVGGSR